MLGKLFKKKTTKPSLYEKDLFLFAMPNAMESVMHVLCEAFGAAPSGGSGNTLDLNQEDMKIGLAVISEDMGEKAKAYIKDQRDRTRSHFMQIDTKHTGVKTNLFYHLGMAKSLVTIHYSFHPENIQEKQNMIEDTFLQTLLPLSGVLLIPDQPDAIFCLGKDGKRKLVLSETGESDFNIYLPKLGPELTEIYPDLPAEQTERRNRSRNILKKYGIYVPSFYPVIESETDAHIRTPEEIARRAFALMAVSLYSECLLGEGMTPQEAKDFIWERTESFGAASSDAGFFSPDEWDYLNNPNSSESERINGSWQYENLYVMEWALGLTDSLDFPSHICDVPQTVKLLKNCSSVEDILSISHPRTAAELLDAADLIFCLDWACVDARLYQFPAPAGMEGGVVQERHKSLNWLTGCPESVPWDQVSTNT